MVKKSHNINSITKLILDLEKKYGLLNWKIDNIFIWQVIRVQIYILIQDNVNQNGETVQLYKKTVKEKIVSILDSLYHRIIINSIYYNPFLLPKVSDVLVFESSRKYLVDNKYIDIYTKYLCDDLSAEGKRIQIIQSSYSFDKLSSNRKKTKHLDFLVYLAKLRSIKAKVFIKKKDISKIEAVQKELVGIFNVNIDLGKIINNAIIKFKSEFPIYKHLFGMYQPKEIYLVNFCDKPALIAAAKECGITVNELQHGLMVKEDLIFHFPNSKKGSVEYFPDRFFVWEKIWGNSAILPISENNIINFSNKHLVYISELYKYVKKDRKNILIISQPNLTDYIFSFVLNNMSFFKDYNTVIKLHPMEFSYYERSNIYQILNKHENISFVKNNQSLYLLMAESKFCIGVYSAALIESLYFDNELILLDLPGMELLKHLLFKKKVRLLKKPFKI